MTQYQLLPYQRTARVLNELAGLGISPGTLQSAVRVAATALEAPVNAIRRTLIAAPVAHAAETGRRVNGNLILTTRTQNRPAYDLLPHPKRGAEALDAFGLLAPFAGVLVHDHGVAYQRYQCWHAFCNTHHLRELTAIAERSPNQPRIVAIPRETRNGVRPISGAKNQATAMGLRRPTFVLRPSRRALRAALTLPRFPVLLQLCQAMP